MLAVVVACFAAGAAVRWRRPATARWAPTLDGFVLGIALPALTLATLPSADLGNTIGVPVAVAWAGLPVAWVAVLAAGRAFSWPRSIVGALMLVAAFGNTSFLGLAAVEALLGDDTVAAALAFGQLGTFLSVVTAGTVVAGIYGAATTRPGAVLRQIITFPPFIAVLASIPLRAWPLPDGAVDALDAVGQLVAPVAMVSIGLRFHLTPAAHVRAPAAWGLGIKMVLLPLVAFLAAVLIGDLDDPAWRASVLESGMPPMVTASIIATRAGLDEELSSFVVGAGLVLSAVTLPLLTLLLG